MHSLLLYIWWYSRSSTSVSRRNPLCNSPNFSPADHFLSTSTPIDLFQSRRSSSLCSPSSRLFPSPPWPHLSSRVSRLPLPPLWTSWTRPIIGALTSRSLSGNAMRTSSSSLQSANAFRTMARSVANGMSAKLSEVTVSKSEQ